MAETTACYTVPFRKGTDTRIYIDSNVSGAHSWAVLTGETTAALSVEQAESDVSTKDSIWDQHMVASQSWSMSASCRFIDGDTAQDKVRSALIGAGAGAVRRVAFKISGDTDGYHGYVTIKFSTKAERGGPVDLDVDFSGCGELERS